MNIQDFYKGFQSLTPQKKFIALFLVVSVFTGVLIFTLLARRPDFGLLYANLEETESADVIAKLQEMKVPYRLQAGGRVIEAPRDKVYELRLALAKDGITAGGIAGFELFDKESWNMSHFVQEINYRRALEGELARTIMSMEEIEKARVHLVIPERSPFVGEEESKPKASVVLKIRGSRQMNPAQVKAIVYLVSGSVEGLSPEDVSIIDTEGTLLTGANPSEEGIGAISSYQLEYRREIEEGLERRVTQMLERVVGPGNAVVRISADVDFRKVERKEEIYDPDSVVVRSEQKRSEKVNVASSGSVPGLRSNRPGAAAGAGFSGAAPSEKKEQVLNYEINKVVKHMIESPGAIRRLSVAVLVRKEKEIPETEQARLTSLVKGAVGFDQKRGDQVNVVFSTFEKTVEEELPSPGVLERMERILPPVLKYGGLMAAVVLLIFGVFRPLLNRLSEEGERLERFQKRLPESLEQMERAIPELTQRDKLVKLVEQDPGRAAQIIKMWLREA